MGQVKYLYKIISYLLVFVNVSSCTRANIHSNFTRDIKKQNKFIINNIDTIKKNNRTIIYLNTDNGFVNEVLNNDKKYVLENKKYFSAEIQYEIKQVSTNFISIVKSVYVEDTNSPKGYFSWDECLNFYNYKDGIYKVNFHIYEQELNAKLIEAVKKGEIEDICLNESRKSIEHQDFFIQNGKIYIHYPIEFPACWLDIEVILDKEKIVYFEEIFSKS